MSGLRDPLLVGHAEEEDVERLGAEGAVLHVDDDEVESGPRQRPGIREGAIATDDAEHGFALVEQLDHTAERTVVLGANDRGSERRGEEHGQHGGPT